MKTLWSRLPLAGKVFLICISLALSVSLAGNMLLYLNARHSLRQEVRSKLISIARTAATQIDPELHSTIQSKADESSSAYHKIKAILSSICKANPDIADVYTMRQTNEKHILKFIVDAQVDPAHVGDPYNAKDAPEMVKAFSYATADFEPTEDKWGTWLSGYAPIRDASGHVYAIIGLDMSLKELYVEENSLRRSIKRNIMFAFILAIILSMMVTKAILHPVRIFTSASQRVRDGELDFKVPLSGTDEIGRFGDAFNMMISGLKESRDKLLELSTRDITTGAFNHMYFHERLANEVERAERFGHNLVLMIIDVDRFKTINDNFGHACGDNILLQLTEFIQQSVRRIDVVARYGGDELAIILPETNAGAGQQLANRLRAMVEEHPFAVSPANGMPIDPSLAANGNLINLTVTIGLANYPNHHKTRDGLVMAADIAVLRAKQTARNSVCMYEQCMFSEDVDPQDLYQLLHEPDVAAIRSLAAAVDARDHYTSGHSERVAAYAVGIGKMMGLSPEMIDALQVAGLLHDIGKIGVPDSVLNKPGSLTQDEYETIQKHPSVGGNILSRAPQFEIILPAVLHHHERWDGKGYPNGLQGEGIPYIARILAVADTFDAMTSDRPYRNALTLEIAVAELRKNAGSQFDPEMVEAFSGYMKEANKLAA